MFSAFSHSYLHTCQFSPHSILLPTITGTIPSLTFTHLLLGGLPFPFSFDSPLIPNATLQVPLAPQHPYTHNSPSLFHSFWFPFSPPIPHIIPSLLTCLLPAHTPYTSSPRHHHTPHPFPSYTETYRNIKQHRIDGKGEGWRMGGGKMVGWAGGRHFAWHLHLLYLSPSTFPLTLPCN